MEVARHQVFVRTSDDAHLRRFLARRDAGDEAGARAAWGDLLTAEWPRIRAMVAAEDVLFSGSERDEALQLAGVKLWKDMIGTFRGTTKGEWVNAARRCVWFACRQVQRDAARDRRRESPGLDDQRVAAWRHERFEREQEQRAAAEFLAWALPRVPNPNQRLVLRRTLEGASSDEICDELAVTRDTMYKLRQRGLEALAELKERDDA